MLNDTSVNLSRFYYHLHNNIKALFLPHMYHQNVRIYNIGWWLLAITIIDKKSTATLYLFYNKWQANRMKKDTIKKNGWLSLVHSWPLSGNIHIDLIQ